MAAETIEAPAEESIKITRPSKDAMLVVSNSMLQAAQALVIDSDAMYEVAGEELVSINRKLAELDDKEKSLTGPLLRVVEDIRDLFRSPKQLLTQAQGALKGAMGQYLQDKQAAARKASEEAEAQARKQREEAEARAREEQQRAQALEAQGDATAAAEAAQRAASARLEAQVTTAPAVAVAPAPRAAGVAVRKVWKCALPETDEDKIAALRFIADNPQYLGLVEFSQKTANQLATAQRKGFNIPGFRAYEDNVIAGSRR